MTGPGRAHRWCGAGAAIGFGVDRLTPEPGDAWHPVAHFGRLMGGLERRLWRDDRAAGVAFVATGVAVAVGVGRLLDRAIGRGPATAVAATVSIGGKMLGGVADEIGALLDRDELDAARRRVTALVGRDPSSLDRAGIARAVIESVAENTIDATVAPIVWGAIGGAPGVLAHRAVNTLDAMVGHRSPQYRRFGWAAARLDDAMNWLPARLGAVLVVATHPRRAASIARTVRRHAPAHPSPNGGVIEAAFAAALDVRLGGVNRYGELVEDRGTLGSGPPPTPSDIGRATRLATRIGALTAMLAAGTTYLRRGR